MNKHNVVILCTNVLIILCAAFIVAVTSEAYGLIALICLQRPIAQDFEIDPDDIVTYSSFDQGGIAPHPQDYDEGLPQSGSNSENDSEYSNNRAGFTSQV